ncbi:response regulator [Paraburkholderia aromaticivorans]|uniref:response regulator n=1 Tax=Paraburkholderia aromaticivorans TaxID=2026199 RepID=UPI0014560500|nr:response regulator [Paraburkholderia aromaticivorans]
MCSILLVDDEPDLLAAWHLILHAEGYEVRCAANGAEALELMRQRVPDLVITDWMMPVMGGAELCRRLRTQPNLAQVPILVHTSAPPPGNEATAGGTAWNACLQKPVPMQVFLTTVEGYVRGVDSTSHAQRRFRDGPNGRLAVREAVGSNHVTHVVTPENSRPCTPALPGTISVTILPIQGEVDGRSSRSNV